MEETEKCIKKGKTTINAVKRTESDEGRELHKYGEEREQNGMIFM